MATTTIRFNHDDGSDSVGSFAKLGRMLGADKAREMCHALAVYFEALAGGYEKGNFEIQLAGTTAVRANGYINLSSASGAVGATIGGTLVTVTASGGDAATTNALIAAVNANSTVNKMVYAAAGAASNRTYLYAMSPGTTGNKLTLVLSGTGSTVSGATLTGGAGDDVTPVTFSRS